MKKYFNDAIIGNKNITASFTKKGELLRLYAQQPDYRQFIDYLYAGLQINDSALIKLHDDINNVYHQYFTKDTNILNTEIRNTYFNLKVIQTDFVPIRQNVLVKKYVFTNENTIDLDVSLLIHSSLLTDDNNSVSAMVIDNGMIQYSHDYMIAWVAKKNPVLSHQINDTNANIHTGKIHDKDYIGMAADSSVSYHVGNLKPGETKEIEFYIYIQDNKEIYKMHDMLEKIEQIKKMDYEKELNHTKNYWKKYVKDHTRLDLKEETEYEKKIKNIYNRSILLFPLLTNEQTGGIQAAVEIDEAKTQCGRYAYCWPRDAVFITKAMDLVGMEKETEKFYKNFCKNTQSKNGMWEQRFYTDCRLAPCWGYQIDETASVVYGAYAHYQKTKEEKFLKDHVKMMEKATKYLERYIENLLEIEEKEDLVKKEILENKKQEKEKIHISYDLWEMHEGVSLYSIASIFSAFQCMIKVYEYVYEQEEKEKQKSKTPNRLKQESIVKEKEKLQRYSQKIKQYVLENFYNEEKKTFVRNLEDQKIDISILGAIVPFELFTPKEKKVQNTVEMIDLNLRTYTGGYKRFEEDHYMGGNPWTIATLWRALYYIELKQYKKAKECLDFVVHSATKHGYIAEQVNNETMQPAWVIGLAWAHAMFILVLEKLDH